MLFQMEKLEVAQSEWMDYRVRLNKRIKSESLLFRGGYSLLKWKSNTVVHLLKFELAARKHTV